MTRLLRIDSSSRTSGSHSRALADAFQVSWLAAHPGDEIIVRDLVASPVPHIADITIAGMFTPPDQHTPAMKEALRLSDTLIAELLSADVLLLSVPIYNFTIPSALKAYIDHVSRVGHTFGFDEQKGLHGLITGKKAFIAASYGAAGYFNGGLTSMNFLEPYLRSMLGFLGITDVGFLSVEGSSTDPAALQATTAQAKTQIRELTGVAA
jgi:FMN-dependent NADH-azoreductase